jgi:hypothetical protein
VDAVDDVEVDATSHAIPHIGPIEAKVIRGADGRNYIMEIMRLTPLDANYVKSEKGTALISKEALGVVDDQLVNSFVLRQELVSIYIQVTKILTPCTL